MTIFGDTPPAKKNETTPTPTIPAERKSISYVTPNNGCDIHIDVKECHKSRTNDIKSKHIIMTQSTGINSHQSMSKHIIYHIISPVSVSRNNISSPCSPSNTGTGSIYHMQNHQTMGWIPRKKLLHWACPSFHACR